ncbi:TonB-dependent receptor [Phenylobacterium sp.]|uniref:TonB-dependent receptor plug domain-containing protein n=1 Tax=Phenylobacterium sp. TaxID=1871053 RepID=UPI00121D79A1|nr:TonB-dependent receptor [Phenylobacterium sp.]THD64481.1 MAG: TonB-dependent receptor [Phenylobacterium sp.]
MKHLFLSVSATALLCATGPVLAAEAPASSDVSEVIVTGSRATAGVRAEDSPAPVQVVGAQAIARNGYTDLSTALSTLVPSLNVSTGQQDSGTLKVQAALRGLSPNDTLVLVNGKRRHISADLTITRANSGTGSASVDLSFIPVGAIDHVEVLTDGAAAQYGSDAIAGVVNIILKTNNDSGSVSGTVGEFGSGQGQNGQWSVNKGFSLGDRGFVNVTLEEHYHGFSDQGTYDDRYQNTDGTTKAGIAPIIAANIQNYKLYPNINPGGESDPRYNLYNGFFNAAYDLGGGVEAYAFGNYGYEISGHQGNVRAGNAISGVLAGTTTPYYPLPDGFILQETFDETDASITGGLRGKAADWSWDLATTYGRNDDQVHTINSANSNLYKQLQSLSATPIMPQRNFYDGAFIGGEWNTTLDVDRGFKVGLASPLNVALGLEYRRDTFEIDQGEFASYYLGGSSGFAGFQPLDAGHHARTNFSQYIDLAVDPITNLHIDLAGRHENYSDFGDATVGKFTARYDFGPMFAVRGTISNGFRAPTLEEEYYSGTNVSPTSESSSLPADGAAAKAAGFLPLKPEKSTNYSVGVVAHPMEGLQITADLYQIKITDRILETGSILGYRSGFGTNGVVSQAVLDALTTQGVVFQPGVTSAGISTFTNAADTTTTGFELTANYTSDFDRFGRVDWSLGFNYNENKVNKVNPLPAAVTNATFGQTLLLNLPAVTGLLDETPREKVILGALWTEGKWAVNFRPTIYGPTFQYVSLDGTGTGAGATKEYIGTTAIFDLDIAYSLTKALRFNIGANNLFNTFPPRVPNVPNPAGGVEPPDGDVVYNVPYIFAPWGYNGGYYYVKATYSF